MVTPEIDWWIKNVTQVKNPVYNRKQYEQGINNVSGSENNAVTAMNQDENIKLILITDILISFCGDIVPKPCNFHLVNIIDNNLGNKIFSCYVVGDGTDKPIYLNNIYYIQEGERLNISAASINTLNKQISVGYITVSQKT